MSSRNAQLVGSHYKSTQNFFIRPTTGVGSKGAFLIGKRSIKSNQDVQHSASSEDQTLMRRSINGFFKISNYPPPQNQEASPPPPTIPFVRAITSQKSKSGKQQIPETMTPRGNIIQEKSIQEFSPVIVSKHNISTKNYMPLSSNRKQSPLDMNVHPQSPYQLVKHLQQQNSSKPIIGSSEDLNTRTSSSVSLNQENRFGAQASKSLTQMVNEKSNSGSYLDQNPDLSEILSQVSIDFDDSMHDLQDLETSGFEISCEKNAKQKRKIKTDTNQLTSIGYEVIFHGSPGMNQNKNIEKNQNQQNDQSETTTKSGSVRIKQMTASNCYHPYQKSEFIFNKEQPSSQQSNHQIDHINQPYFNKSNYNNKFINLNDLNQDLASITSIAKQSRLRNRVIQTSNMRLTSSQLQLSSHKTQNTIIQENQVIQRSSLSPKTKLANIRIHENIFRFDQPKFLHSKSGSSLAFSSRISQEEHSNAISPSSQFGVQGKRVRYVETDYQVAGMRKSLI